MPISTRRNRVLIVTLGLALMAGCKGNTPAPTATAGKPMAPDSVASVQPAQTATATIAGGESPAETSANTDSAEPSTTLTVKGIAFTVPEGWIQEKPNSTMRVAQFVLPGDTGSATLVITYFGADGAGPRDLNVKRWIEMVAVADEAADDAKPQTETISHNGLQRTVVVATGALSAPSMRPGVPTAAPKPDHTLYGVILEDGPEGPLYLKAVGPAGTISAQTAAIEAFVKSARKAE